MKNKIVIRWDKLANVSIDTKKRAEQMEQARVDYQNVINSLNECWEGTDATAFINNCNNFLNELKKDTLYFEALGNYFNMSSESYKNVVESHAERLDKINEKLREEKKFNFLSNNEMVGVNDGNY